MHVWGAPVTWMFPAQTIENTFGGLLVRLAAQLDLRK
jgi:hypothetical protein